MDNLRPYQIADRDACLALFDGNCPAFFAPGERDDFVDFLARRAQGPHFLVIERAGQLLACGGHATSTDGRCASLCWGMVDPRLQRQGLGSRLLQARLATCRRTPGLERVILDTSQRSRAFYARFGFQVQRVTPDGYGPGLDRCDMLLQLA